MSKSYWALSILVIAVVAFFLFPGAYERFFGSLNPKQPENTQSAQNVTLTGAQIGERIVPFVRSAMKSDGSFYPAYLCAQGSGCRPQDSQKSSYAGYAIASLLVYSLRTHDASFRASADTAIAYALSRCAADASTCEFHFRGFQEYYKITNDQKYLDAMVKAGESVLKRAANPSKNTLVSIATTNTVEKLQYLHEVTKDKKYQSALLKVADTALSSGLSGFSTTAYREGSMNVDAYGPIVANRVLLQAFDATKDEKYLTAAKDYFDAAKIDAHVQDLRGEGFPIVSLLMNAAEAHRTFATNTKDSNESMAEQKIAAALLQRLINTNYDSTDHPLFDGSNNFIAPNESFKRDGSSEFYQSNYKTVNNNAWIALDFLAMFSDFKFTAYIPR